MLAYKKVLVLFLTIFCLNIGYSQQDTLFWFAAPNISSGIGESPIYLRLLSYDAPATVTISQPANGAFLPITVNLPANGLDSVNLTAFIAQIESPAANVVATTGLKISSTSEISAFYEVKTTSNKEIFSLKIG